MSSTFTKLYNSMLDGKPEYERYMRELRSLNLDDGLLCRDFFMALKDIAVQTWSFGHILEHDPLLNIVSLEDMKQLTDDFYKAVDPETGYATCLGNPDHAVEQYGSDLGGLISTIYTNFRSLRQMLLNKSYTWINHYLKIYFTLLEHAKNGNNDYNTWIEVYREETTKDLELITELNTFQRLSPEYDYYKRIVAEADLSDIRYLYRYGIYLSEYDFAMAEFMSKYPETELLAISKFIVQSWVDGFVRAKKDYTKKKYANLMIPCGMERLGRMLIADLTAIGMEVIVPLPHSNGINRQFGYDHRFDGTLTLDRERVESSLKASEKIIEDLKELISAQAGPVYVELFGETPFSPVSKSSALKYSPEQQQLAREQGARYSQMYYKYYRRDEGSFTIIAFPSPEIGKNFPEIFADTLKINLLDSMHYARIQQKIIDVLDTAEYVHVKGKAGNDTDIMVRMHPITDPATQTNFENCVADVNIPVGEVFTSPLLTGTNGVLHVEDIYLGSLRYYNLRIKFTDGWVESYSCSNFDNAEDGSKYIHENLLLPHDTLPIGEFAIGTNTTAYQIARKHDILALLPILIIEKMGPHFAIGDTCFSHEEDAPHPSFMNGKEMIAVDNEKSRTRDTDPMNAYTQKHMDITLPYEMLESITAITKDGHKAEIIRDGRFVVPGTEELNIPLDEGW